MILNSALIKNAARICLICFFTSVKIWGQPMTPPTTEQDVLTELEKGGSTLLEKNILTWLKHFVSYPHPFATPNQKTWILEVAQASKKLGMKPEIQEFTAKAPSRDKPGLQQDAVGRNIVFKLNGQRPCWGILGGHSDTKMLAGLRLPSANDGGSSSALLLEIARSLYNSKPEVLPICTLWVVLFDGEESVLERWDDGQKLNGQRDNLYGSRHFVKTLGQVGNKPDWVIILDMIGHKDQVITITSGSAPRLKSQFLNFRKSRVRFEDAPSFTIEDDHLPFAEASIPYLHLIDWTNRKEWHTPQDTLSILSIEKIKNLGEILLSLLKSDKLNL